MSRSSISTASKIPTKLPARSAWAKGPPQSPTISPRSQSPATPTPVYTHSRRSSTLGEGVPINDGVSVPHSNAGTVKQASPASAVSFNSVGDVHAARYSNLPPPQQLSPSQLPQMSSGSGPVPRSRQLPSGNDTRPESGPDGGPVQAPVEPSRPRLGSHPQSGRSSGVPLPPPQLQPQVVAPGSPGYYYPGGMGPEQQHYVLPSPPQSQHQHPQHHPPLPGPHGPHDGMSQNHSHSSSDGIGGLSSPPPTLSSALSPGLNANSDASVPTARTSKITVKSADGTPIKLEALAGSTSSSAASASIVPSFIQAKKIKSGNRRPMGIQMETTEQRQQRLAEEEAKEAKEAKEAEVRAEERAEKEKEEAEMDQQKEALRINTSSIPPSSGPSGRQPLPLNLSDTKVTAPRSVFAAAQSISDLSTVTYPEGINGPKVELNVDTKNGKFRYDRDFLLQFMATCKEKPDMLTPLDTIGLELTDQSPGPTAPSRHSSVRLGLGSGRFSKSGSTSLLSMGNFGAPPGGSKLSSEERLNMANNDHPLSASEAAPFSHPTQMQDTPSQGGPSSLTVSSKRTRSKRGEKRNDRNKVGGQPDHGSGHNHAQPSSMNQPISSTPITPSQATANRWGREAADNADASLPEFVRFQGLLNNLTMMEFNFVSGQIITWVNKSGKKDGRTLIQVVRLVLEKAIDDEMRSEMYARLCQKMTEQISPKFQDEGIRNAKGRLTVGGQLFRKCLLKMCQENFERGWATEEAIAAAAADGAVDGWLAGAASEGDRDSGSGTMLYSDEYYAMQKARRRGLGLVKFIGELFKLQMLTERIMHEHIKKLLRDVDHPKEDEIESLCKLLNTIGATLDTPKARAHIDVYFSRIRVLTTNGKVSSRIQLILQDLLELRARKWVTSVDVSAPTTTAQIHGPAANEKAATAPKYKTTEAEATSKIAKDSREFFDVRNLAEAELCFTTLPTEHHFRLVKELVSTAITTEGDAQLLADFFARVASRNLCSPDAFERGIFAVKSDLTTAELGFLAFIMEASLDVERRMRVASILDTVSQSFTAGGVTAEGEIEMTEEQAKKKITEDSKEFFAVRNLDEAEVYFTALPAQHHFRLVDKLVSTAVELKEADAQLVADLFARAVSKSLCTPAAFEKGATPTAGLIDQITIHAPKALSLFAIILKGAKLNKKRRTRLGLKSMNSDKLLALPS